MNLQTSPLPYDRFIDVILRKASCAGLTTSKTWREFIQVTVDGYFGAIEADPVVARAFQLEMDAIGATARQRRRTALSRFAEVRIQAQEELRKTDPLLNRQPFTVHLASVYGVRDLACDALEASKEPNFSELTPEVVDWIVAAWYGHRGRAPRAPDWGRQAVQAPRSRFLDRLPSPPWT